MSTPDPGLSESRTHWRARLHTGEMLKITLLDGTVLHGRVVSASPPNDDGSVTYTVSWGSDDDVATLTAKAEALRAESAFFRSLDMDAAADHCEQSALSWESAADDAKRRAGE